MKKHFHIAFSAAFMLILIQCKKQEDRSCFKSAGSLQIREEVLDAFTELEIFDYVDVYIVRDSLSFARIEGGKNLINHIRFKQNNNRLSIRNSNKCSWTRKYNGAVKVYLHTPEISLLEYKGAGNVYCLDTIQTHVFTINQRNGSGSCYLLLDTDTCYLNMHTGPGDFTVSGKSTVGMIFGNGNGFIKAQELDIYHCYANAVGTGDIQVNVSNFLHARIAYIGNVFYKGNPTHLIEEKYGKGGVFKLE